MLQYIGTVGASLLWYCWWMCLSVFQSQTSSITDLEIRPVIILTLATLCFSAVLIMDCLYHKWLDTNNKTGNPIKLVFQVLNYAQKNKCPRLRSALTYIDEEHPSRLDFGKHKFGGPLTEEEVEDVKTIFRLIPVLLSSFGVTFLCELGLSQISVNKHTIMCGSSIQHSTVFIGIANLVLIPVYCFMVYPLAGKYIPSFLKMIGAGLILCLLSMHSGIHDRDWC